MEQYLDLPQVIFEVANVHAGNLDHLIRVVKEYQEIDYQNKAIKFQPLKPDQLALPDYQWFPVYQELYFEPQVWQEVIALAAGTGKVWLDIFDRYGVEVLAANQHRIVGIKLQASVLDNSELVDALAQMDLTQLLMIINVSGHEISSIEQYVAKFRQLGLAEIILQIGFQGYPTALTDTGLQKIPVLQAAFPGFRFCLADHVSGELAVARQIPAWATLAGCAYVEKHFCLRRSETKYDHFSALEPEEFREMLNHLREVVSASRGPFISASEAKYLKSSYQAPIARHDLTAGSMVGLADLSFRRTNQSGMTWAETVAEQNQFKILSRPIRKDSTFSKGDFVPARIGAVVACRMKSSRLKKKALLPIHGVPSVERCLQNCLLMPHVGQVVLATSTLDDDAVLKDHAVGERVKFWQGDPDDVIQRYLGACEHYGIDVIVRVTADCPVVSPEITGLLLKSHFETGADYTASRNCAVGSSPEIYNAEALRRVISLLGKADYSEYMTWYMKNNADIFKVNLVDIPAELLRDYRLTLDYPEDLEMFDRLYSILDEKKLEPTLVNVLSVLDGDPVIPKINKHLTLVYQTDQDLIAKLNKVTRITKS